MDYYQILELAIKYHPDKNKKFKKISEAYQVLSNKEKI